MRYSFSTTGVPPERPPSGSDVGQRRRGPDGGLSPSDGAPRPSAFRVWMMGARPHTLPAAAAPVVAGGGLAAAHGAFAAGPFAAALLGALLIQIGTNFANDYFDFVKGADTDERRGFTRVTQAGLASPGRVRRWMIGAFATAFLPGLYLVWVGGWPIVAVGLLSVGAGLAYTGGPWPLGYHGLGEVFVFVFFGLVAVAGTYWVQALRLDPGALAAGTGVGALCAAILVVNNLRDLETDARAGKRTLAVRLGVTGTRIEYALLLGVAAAVPALGVRALGWSAWSGLSCLGVAAALPSLRTVTRTRDPGALDRALAGTGRAVALYGLLLGVGLVL